MKPAVFVLVSALASACTYQVRDLDAVDTGDSVPGTDGVLPDADGDDDNGGGGGDVTDSDPMGGDATCGVCAECLSGQARQHAPGESDCCGICVAVRGACAAPPPKCSEDTDCSNGQECVRPYNVCGTPVNGGHSDFGGGVCNTSVCPSGASFYFGPACCPGCDVPCGTNNDLCPIDACKGTSCQCSAGDTCTTSICSCTL